MDLETVGAAAARDAGGIDPGLLQDFLATVVDATSTGRRLRRHELAACGQAGRRAAESGVPLRAVVDLYLSAAWRLWRDVPAVHQGDGDRVRTAALSVLRAADDGVAAVAEGFQLARADLARLQEGARHDVLEALLAGGDRAVGATDAAAALGLALAGPVAVLVAAGSGTSQTTAGDDGRCTGPGAAALPGRVERALQGAHGDSHPLVLLRAGELVCVFEAPDAAAVAEVVDEVVGELDAFGGPWRAAVSTARLGPAGVRAGHDEARYALELAQRLALPEAVVRAGDLAVYRVLLRDRAAVHDLITTVLTPLTTARGGAQPLLDTLDAYYATGCVATAAAARLHLSVRALTYRLARITDLLGRDPADPAERFTVQAAVTAARLLDWPRKPQPSP